MTLECALVLSLHRLYQLETPILFQIHEVNISLECALHDRFQTKMSPTISFSGMYRKPFIYRTAGCKLSLVIVAHRRLGRKPKSDTQGPIIRVVFSLTFWRQQVSVFFHVYTVVQGRKARNNKNAHRHYLGNYDVSYQVYVKLRELSEPPTQL